MDRRGRPDQADDPDEPDDFEALDLFSAAELWYPRVPADEPPDQRAARRARYADAIEATRFNLPPVGGSPADAVALAQLIPPRRGVIQGPAAASTGTEGEKPRAAPGPGRAGLSRAGRIMAMGTIVSRVTGMLRTSMLTSALGLGLMGSAFTTANNVPNAVYLLIVGGAINSVFVPQLVRAMKDDPDGGRRFTDRLLTMAIIVLAALTIACVVLAPQIVSLYAGKYTGATRAVTIEMTRYCAPQILCYGMFVMFGQILNARDRFGPMMWTPALANVVMIATLAAFMASTGGAQVDPARLTDGQVRLLAIGTTFGVVLQTAALIPYAAQAGTRFRPRFDWRGTGLGAPVRLARWTVLMVLVGQVGTWLVTDIGNTMDVRYPGDGVGFVAFSNALTTWILPQAVITVSIATALLPRMSRAAQDGDRRGVRASVSLGTRVSACAVVPCAFAFVAFGQQITAVLFGHGNADPTMVRNTGFLLMALAPGLIPYSAQTMMLRGFYAYEDTKTPFKAALWAGAANLVLSLGAYLLLRNSPWAMLGVCAASSATYIVAAAITARLLRRRLHGLEARRIVRTHAKLGGASAVAAAVGAPAALAIELTLGHGTVGTLSALAVGGAAFAALFLIAARALRIREIQTLFGLVRTRLAG